MTAPAATRLILRTVLIVVATVLTLYVIYLLRKPLSWIFIAMFIAIAVSGPVNFLSRKMKRGVAIAIVYLAIILVPFLLAGAIVPSVVTQVNHLVDKAPEYAQDLQDFVRDNDTLRKLEDDYQITEKIQEKAKDLPNKIDDVATILGDIGLGLVNSLFALITIFILSIFLVGSGPLWIRKIISLQPQHRRERLEHALYSMGNAVGNYVAGALVQATVAGVLTFVVLTVLGMPFAAPLAIIVAFFDLIPLVGATIAAVLVGILTLFNDFPTTTIVWVIWSIVYQQLENNIIQPQIQKRAVDVHPFIVLTAVLFGSTLFGIPGALMAIPIAASIQIAVTAWWDYRREQQADSGGPGPPPEPLGPPGPQGPEGPEPEPAAS